MKLKFVVATIGMGILPFSSYGFDSGLDATTAAGNDIASVKAFEKAVVVAGIVWSVAQRH